MDNTIETIEAYIRGLTIEIQSNKRSVITANAVMDMLNDIRTTALKDQIEQLKQSK